VRVWDERGRWYKKEGSDLNRGALKTSAGTLQKQGGLKRARVKEEMGSGLQGLECGVHQKKNV